LPIDALVLGMGDDGHTASFFPGGDHLAEAIDAHTRAIVLPMRAPAAGEARITLSLPVVIAAHSLYLHIEGEKKKTVLQNALASDSQLPISAVLRHAHSPVQIFWCA
jgi:6-phosphogluconolactonase